MSPRIPRFLVLLLLVGLVPATAQRAPIVTLPPQHFDDLGAVSEPALIPALGGQTHPAIASNGDGWLVAWSDSRYGSTADPVRAEDIFATAIDSSGHVLHPEGIPVAPTWASDRYPSVVWTGSSYLVVWSSPIGIFGAHLDAKGAFLRSGILVEATGFFGMQETAIARSGDRLLLLWSESAPGWTHVIRWRLLDTEGTPLTAASDLAPSSFGSQRNPAVGFTADRFVVAWEEIAQTESRVFAITMTEEGRLGPSHPVGDGPARSGTVGMWTSQASPSVSNSSDGALIVWTDGQIQAREFDESGPARETLTIPSDGVAVAPHVVRNGPAWVVAFSSGDVADPGVDGSPGISSLDVYVAALSSPVSLGPVKRIAAPEAQIGVALGSNGREVFTAWTDFRFSASTDHPFAARFVGDLFGGTLGRALLDAADPLAFGRAEQRPLAIATMDGLARVLWAENLDDDEEGLFTRGFTTAAVPTDEPRLLARGGYFAADIGAGADGFAAAWEGYDGVFATVLAADGVPKGDPILVDAAGSSPAVASDGRDFLVAWDSPTPQDQTYRSRKILIGVLRDDATFAAPPVELSMGPSERPRATWTGSRYLVVWGDTGSSFSGRGTTGRFVTSSGSPLGAEPLVFARFMKYQSGPWSVASSGAEHLIGTSGQMIVTDAEGTIVEFLGPWLGPALSVAWVGDLFVVAPVASGRPGTAGLWPIEIAPAGPGSVLAIAAKRTAPLPLAHSNTTGRAVLAKSKVHSERRRLAARE